MANILILRFSAIGDVAMTVPVVDSLARAHPDNRFTVVSQPFLSPLFAHCPDNVLFEGIDLKGTHKGIAGIFRFYKKMRQNRYDAVADLHDVLRTKLLRFFFRCNGLKVRHIDKGRPEKRRLVTGKKKQQLKTSVERYADVFRALGFTVNVDFHSVFGTGKGDFAKIEEFAGAKTGKWIGIAPFAKHTGKIYPLERTEQVVAQLAGRANTTLFLFGGGEHEKQTLENWAGKYPNTIRVAGKLKLAEELVLISHLDVMLSMDSANMHIASLTATPVVSVWGATHPYTGFYGYRQLPTNAVQVDLPCRPCSVYGNKPCRRKDYACLMQIPQERVIETINTGDTVVIQ
ncbi:MAG: glycosyltransferase family 9 protein [Bacteroidales bacterium]|jgi:ADP-heptose:LPS heptosyltransferase|nr:glycosyltransferase family 9 protein [Bacteroidales bacterium]